MSIEYGIVQLNIFVRIMPQMTIGHLHLKYRKI